MMMPDFADLPVSPAISILIGVVVGWVLWWSKQGLVALIQTRQANRLGIASKTAEARRDTIADRDALIERYRVVAEEERAKRIECEVLARERLIALNARDGYIDLLEDVIWRTAHGGPVPTQPPKRPY